MCKITERANHFTEIGTKFGQVNNGAQETSSGRLLLRLRRIQNSIGNFGARFEPLWAEDMSHKWCSICFEFNLVRIQFKIVLRESFQELKYRVVMSRDSPQPITIMSSAILTTPSMPQRIS